jgi:membrane associated rhomboid family serine protease
MVVPIYDDNPFTQPIKPVVTWTLIALNLLIFLYEMMASETGLDRMIEIFSLIPAAFIGDIATRGWVPASVTLVTYQFFHADLMHVFGNMIFLWVFGDDIERALGRGRYLLFYLLCGVIGGLVFVANDPHSKIELIGASGAIAGVVIAYVMLRPCAKITVLLGIIPLRLGAYWVVGLFAGGILFPLLKPAGIKLFQCMQPVPDTVVQIGPNPAAIASRRGTQTP